MDVELIIFASFRPSVLQSLCLRRLRWLISEIEKFITNNRMRNTTSSENLNKRAFDLPRPLRQSDGVKAAV